MFHRFMNFCWKIFDLQADHIPSEDDLLQIVKEKKL